MEARPPEEPTPARVTSDVPKTKPETEKNPGRVASGKRLAERNRLACEAKKKAEATTSAPNNTSGTTSATSDKSNNSVYLILGVGGLIVSALGVYYQREAIMKTLRQKEPAPSVPPPEPTPSPAKTAPKRIRGME